MAAKLCAERDSEVDQTSDVRRRAAAPGIFGHRVVVRLKQSLETNSMQLESLIIPH